MSVHFCALWLPNKASTNTLEQKNNKCAVGLEVAFQQGNKSAKRQNTGPRYARSSFTANNEEESNNEEEPDNDRRFYWYH
jgi:hypothetical protein